LISIFTQFLNYNQQKRQNWKTILCAICAFLCNYPYKYFQSIRVSDDVTDNLNEEHNNIKIVFYYSDDMERTPVHFKGIIGISLNNFECILDVDKEYFGNVTADTLMNSNNEYIHTLNIVPMHSARVLVPVIVWDRKAPHKTLVHSLYNRNLCIRYQLLDPPDTDDWRKLMIRVSVF
jgi:hypothetical protein